MPLHGYINLDNQGKKNPQKTKGNRPLPYKKTKKENTKGIMPSYVSDRRRSFFLT